MREKLITRDAIETIVKIYYNSKSYGTQKKPKQQNVSGEQHFKFATVSVIVLYFLL